jgi:DNA replication initiation complex subunit (GINS family)
MTTKDLRKEIGRAVQEIPDSFLEDVLDYLRQIEKRSSNELENLHFIKKIMKEDHELLEHLAK